MTGNGIAVPCLPEGTASALNDPTIKQFDLILPVFPDADGVICRVRDKGCRTSRGSCGQHIQDNRPDQLLMLVDFI